MTREIRQVTSDAVDLEAKFVLLRFVFASCRTALLNRKYYEKKLARYQKYNLFMEIAIAVGATSSGGIAGMAIWGSITGQYAWLIITGVATVLGVVKPILQIGRNIEKYSNLYSGHSSVYFDLIHIMQDIELTGSIGSTTSEKFGTIRDRLASLGGLHDPAPHAVLTTKLQSDVNREIPPERLDNLKERVRNRGSTPHQLDWLVQSS